MQRLLICVAVGLGLLFGALAPMPASAYYYHHGYYHHRHYHHYHHHQLFHHRHLSLSRVCNVNLGREGAAVGSGVAGCIEREGTGGAGATGCVERDDEGAGVTGCIDRAGKLTDCAAP